MEKPSRWRVPGALRRRAGALAGAAFFTAVIAAGLSGAFSVQDVAALAAAKKEYLQSAGKQGLTLFALADILLIVCCQPGSFFLELFAGFVFGVSVGTALIFAAKMCAALVCYVLGNVFFADWVSALLAKNATFDKFKKEAGSRQGFKLIVGLRLSPIPSYLCSYGASVS